MTDEALMREVRDGDVGRLGLLFERHHGGVAPVPRRRLENSLTRVSHTAHSPDDDVC